MIFMDGAINVCECVKMLARRIAASFKTNLAEGEGSGMTVIQRAFKKLSSRQKSNLELVWLKFRKHFGFKMTEKHKLEKTLPDK